jgi:hypothetical protein
LSILADDHTTGSDHEVIKWVVEVVMQEEADHERVIEWNLAAITEQDVETAMKLWMERVKMRAHMDADCCKEDEVEQEAIWCQRALSKDLNATEEKIRICTKSKRWWNCDIEERRNILGQKKGKGRDLEPAARAKAALQKSFWKFKRQMWSN